MQTYNWTKIALCDSTLSGGLQAEKMAFRRSFSKHYTHSNIQLNKVGALWNSSEWWASSRSKGFQKKFFKTIITFKHTIEQNMRSVEVHWGVGFKEMQWFSEVVFWNIIHILTYNWTKYALCERTLSGGLQAETMAFRRSFLKHYTHANIQLNKVCALWKYTEGWTSRRSDGFQKLFFETSYTFKLTIEKKVRSVKVTWVVGFKQKQRLSEEVFWNIIHMQTYNWTKYALCDIILSGGLQAEKMDFRRSFSKHYTHSNIQVNKVCALGKYSEWGASIRSKGFRKKFFKTLYTFKHTIEQSMRSVKVQWVVGFRQKQWLLEEVFQNIIHIQTYNWTKYALCESTVSGGLQAEAKAFRRIFSKHYTHSNIQLNKVCALWKYTEGWTSRRSDGFQKLFFETSYTFKHTIEKNVHSVKVTWVVGFKQKQWLSEEVFWNIIHMQTYNWTKYALCDSILSGGLQAEKMDFRRSFSKLYTHSNIQLNKLCALGKNSEW